MQITEQQNNVSRYRLFWPREESGGRLTGNEAVDGAALEDLPINETLASRLRAVTPTGEDNTGTGLPRLFLPFLSLRERNQWPHRQMELPVTATIDGRIVAGNDAQQQFGGLLAGDGPVVFNDRRTWHGPRDWDYIVRPMLDAHRVPVPEGWRPAGPFEIAWTIELPPAFKRFWREIPHRRDAAFLEQFRGLSTSIQRALRLWLPYQYFHPTARYHDPLRCKQYMVYSVLPAHPSRRKTQLTFNVLEPQRVLHSMMRIGKPVAELLRRASRRARAAGIDHSPFSTDPADSVVETMRKLPRIFGALLNLEAFLVEELIIFAATCLEMRRSESVKARLTVDAGHELHNRFHCRLGRSYGGESYTNLTTLVLAAATSGLAWHGADPAPLHCRVQIQDAIDSGEPRQRPAVRLESRFSYATN